jgi:quinolinate synthase
MNGLQGVLACLRDGSGEIAVPEPVRVKAHTCITRMLDFTASHTSAAPSSTAAHRQGLVPNIGAA